MRQKKKKNGKEDSASAPSRFALLIEGEMQQILTERHSGKTKQMTNWSVSTFKGNLKFFRFKIVKCKTRTFKRKFEIKPIPVFHNISLNANNHFWYCCPFFASDLMHNSTGHKTIGSCFKLCTIESWSTWAVWRALKKLELPSAIASGNSYASFIPRAP